MGIHIHFFSFLMAGLISLSASFYPSDGSRIFQIQGKSHTSPLVNQEVKNVRGVVVALNRSERFSGFWMQDPEGDGDPVTSDGLFISFSLDDAIQPGVSVAVDGRVEEKGFSGELTRTQIQAREVRILSTGNALPEPVTIGNGGRVPPGENIDDDGMTRYEPATDGIDFYESLEGMRVQVSDAVVIAPTSRYGEIAVLPDHGMNAHLKSRRGGIVVRQDDFNPEIVIFDDLLVENPPQVKVGDKFSGTIAGIIDYSFGNFKFLNLEPLLEVDPSELMPEVTELVSGPDLLTVASFNVENLHFKDSQKKYRAVASTIANNLASPDIIALQEIQDNSGPDDDGVVDADSTLHRLVEVIARLSGNVYQFCQLNPDDKADGGQPGGNIRVGFLYNPKRVSLKAEENNPQKIGVADSAFFACRKSLVAEFMFNGHTVTLINNHLKSKRGDDGLFGINQPPQFKTEPQRSEQARIINTFVKSVLQHDPKANVIVLGDMNEHEFREPIRILADAGLTDMLLELPTEDRYTYIYNGNSQVLDHILLSPNLSETAKPELDIVHVNAEFPSRSRSSDHDPLVTRLRLSQ